MGWVANALKSWKVGRGQSLGEVRSYIIMVGLNVSLRTVYTYNFPKRKKHTLVKNKHN